MMICFFPAGGVPSFGQPEQTPQPEQQEVDTEMGPSVTIMKPILRFLQLLCENHNLDLQVWPTSEYFFCHDCTVHKKFKTIRDYIQ